MAHTLAERMLGQTVIHKLWGSGKVTFCSNVAMKVLFDQDGRETAFAFPYAFKQFLRVENPELMEEINAFYDSGDWTKSIHCHND